MSAKIEGADFSVQLPLALPIDEDSNWLKNAAICAKLFQLVRLLSFSLFSFAFSDSLSSSSARA